MMDDSAPRKLVKTYKNALLRKWIVVAKYGMQETYSKNDKKKDGEENGHKRKKSTPQIKGKRWERLPMTWRTPHCTQFICKILFLSVKFVDMILIGIRLDIGIDWRFELFFLRWGRNTDHRKEQRSWIPFGIHNSNPIDNFLLIISGCLFFIASISGFPVSIYMKRSSTINTWE